MKITDKTLILVGRPCPDYKNILQGSTRCQNCRYNNFLSAEKQYCRVHTPEEAKRKGAPNEAPKDHFQRHMDMVYQHELERLQQEQQIKMANGNL